MYFTESTFQEQWVTDTLLNGAPKNVQWSIQPTPGRKPTLTVTCMNQVGRTESQELHVPPSPAGGFGRHMDVLQSLINSNPEDAKDGSSWVPSARRTTHSGMQTILRTTTPPTYTVTLRIWNQEPTGISTGALRPFTSWVLTTQATHANILPAPPGTLPTVTLTSSQTGDIVNSPYQWVSHTAKVDDTLQPKLNTLESVKLDYITATYVYTLDRKNIKYVEYIVPVDNL